MTDHTPAASAAPPATLADPLMARMQPPPADPARPADPPFTPQTFADMRPGDVFGFSVEGEICSPLYVTIEHGLVYKMPPSDQGLTIDARPRRIGPELEVTRVAYLNLAANRVSGLLPPELPADTIAHNDAAFVADLDTSAPREDHP